MSGTAPIAVRHGGPKSGADRVAMHRNGRNSVEDGEAVAWASGPCRTTDRDGRRWARVTFPSLGEKAGAVGASR